jgi:hypothetical protein
MDQSRWAILPLTIGAASTGDCYMARHRDPSQTAELVLFLGLCCDQCEHVSMPQERERGRGSSRSNGSA